MMLFLQAFNFEYLYYPNAMYFYDVVCLAFQNVEVQISMSLILFLCLASFILTSSLYISKYKLSYKE